MQLHKYIPDKELPLALRRPLVFGDKEQISALYDLEAKIKKMETEQAEISGDELKCFNITIDFSGSQEIEVIAKNRDNAEEKAMEIADFYSVDIETDCVSVVEIKNKRWREKLIPQNTREKKNLINTENINTFHRCRNK